MWPGCERPRRAGTVLAAARGRPPSAEMQQTLLALAATVAFAFFALTRHEDDASLERRSVSDHIEQAAEDLARARLADLSRLAFDEDDIGAPRIRTEPPVRALGADPGEDAPTLFDDVDDAASHEAVAGTPEIRAVQVGSGTVPVRVVVGVRYVDPTDPSVASPTPTLAKEVSVEVTEVVPTNAPTRRVPVRVVLRSVFTPSGMSVGA